MNEDKRDNSQIEQLVKRAQEDEVELLPLLMPEGENADQPQQDTPSTADEDEDEDRFSKKSTSAVLMESLADDEGEKVDFSLPHVLRGDILTAQWLRRQIWWLIMVVVMAFIYVSNRYYAQKQIIHNNHLKKELRTAHFDAMARSSQLMHLCRRSDIMEQLAQRNSTLKVPDRQPVIIDN